MKTLFVDCETTGTDPKKHALIQMAGALFIERQMVEQFNLTIKPFPEDQIEDEALKVNGRTREELGAFRPPREVYQMFVEMLGKHCDKFNKLDKIHMVGYNADFDADFIREWFRKCGDVYFGSWFWFPILDVSKLAGLRLMQRRAALPNFKLMTVAQHLGVNLEGDAHDALYDVRVTMRMFKTLSKDLALFTEE